MTMVLTMAIRMAMRTYPKEDNPDLCTHTNI